MPPQPQLPPPQPVPTIPQAAPIVPDVEDVHLHFSIATEFSGAVIGKAGARIKEIQQQSGCKFKLMDRNSTNGEGRGAFLVGPISGAHTAQNLVQQVLREARAAAGQAEPETDSYACTMLIRK